MEISISNLVSVSDGKHHDTVLEKLWGLIRNREKVDFGFAGSGRVLWAHQLILGLFFHPEQLLDMSPQHWQGSNMDLLLEFIYLGTVGVPEEQMDTLLELARQLDFTMLVDALLAAKHSIRVSNSTSCSGARISDFRIGDIDIFSCVSDPASLLSATEIHTNSAQVVNETRDDWAPVLLKLEPDLSASHRNNGASFQQDVGGESAAPDVDAEAEYNARMSSVSVTIVDEPRSEIKLEAFETSCDWSEEVGAANKADRRVGGSVDRSLCSQIELRSGTKARAPESASERPRRAGCATPMSSNIGLGSDSWMDERDIRSSDEQNVPDDSQPQFGGAVKGLKRSGVLNSASKKCKKSSSETTMSRNINSQNVNQDMNIISDSVTDTGIRVFSADIRRRFKCGICQGAFSRRNQLSNHCRLHTGQDPSKCDVCHLEFSNEFQFAYHAHTHPDEEEAFKCQLCGKIFVYKYDLKRHYRLHTGEKPYKCNVCPKAFNMSGDLTRHSKIHTGLKPYKCNVCSKTFRELHNLNRHARIHTVE